MGKNNLKETALINVIFYKQSTQSASGVMKAGMHKMGQSYANLAKLFVAVIRKPTNSQICCTASTNTTILDHHSPAALHF